MKKRRASCSHTILGSHPCLPIAPRIPFIGTLEGTLNSAVVPLSYQPPPFTVPNSELTVNKNLATSTIEKGSVFFSSWSDTPVRLAGRTASRIVAELLPTSAHHENEYFPVEFRVTEKARFSDPCI